MSDHRSALVQKTQLCRALTLAGLGGLILLLASRDGSWVATLILCLPFTLILPGVIYQHYRSYSWLSLMILLYFIMAVTDAMAVNGAWFDWLKVALCASIFFSATFGSRWLQQLLLCQQNSRHNNFNENQLSKDLS